MNKMKKMRSVTLKSESVLYHTFYEEQSQPNGKEHNCIRKEQNKKGNKVKEK